MAPVAPRGPAAPCPVTAPQHCCRGQQCAFLSPHPQDPAMKEFHARGSQLPDHTPGRDVSWGSDSDPGTLAHHASRRAPLHLFLTYSPAPPPAPGPRAALTSHPKDLPAFSSSVLLCSFWTRFWAHSMLAPPFHQLPTFSNKEPHLGVL